MVTSSFYLKDHGFNNLTDIIFFFGVHLKWLKLRSFSSPALKIIFPFLLLINFRFSNWSSSFDVPSWYDKPIGINLLLKKLIGSGCWRNLWRFNISSRDNDRSRTFIRLLRPTVCDGVPVCGSIFIFGYFFIISRTISPPRVPASSPRVKIFRFSRFSTWPDCKMISPSSNFSETVWSVTPVVSWFESIALPSGFDPRHCGRWDGWTFTQNSKLVKYDFGMSSPKLATTKMSASFTGYQPDWVPNVPTHKYLIPFIGAIVRNYWNVQPVTCQRK